ncbi:hypothetical protein K523DRAFT_122477 [Schizophyllum commune Tattone D]|nr:hypothetical protein K523DRAFT_122477 [Schizophyllum commune Tattone D]
MSTPSDDRPSLSPSTSGTSARPPPVKLKRGSVACKRCRRLRSKCVHENATPPCVSCRDAGAAEAAECFFPRRGEDSSDREYRTGRVRANPTTKSARKRPYPEPEISVTPEPSVNIVKSSLPPTPELIEACQAFMTSYFQLGTSPHCDSLQTLNKMLRIHPQIHVPRTPIQRTGLRPRLPSASHPERICTIYPEFGTQIRGWQQSDRGLSEASGEYGPK